MTQEGIAKFVPGSGRAIYKAKYVLNWQSGRIRPGQEFEFAYPIKANPDSYEVVEVLVEPELKAGGKAKSEKKAAPVAAEADKAEAPKKSTRTRRSRKRKATAKPAATEVVDAEEDA